MQTVISFCSIRVVLATGIFNLSISLKWLKFEFSCSISARSFTKYVLAKSVCTTVLSPDLGLPIHIQSNGVNLKIGPLFDPRLPEVYNGDLHNLGI